MSLDDILDVLEAQDQAQSWEAAALANAQQDP